MSKLSNLRKQMTADELQGYQKYMKDPQQDKEGSEPSAIEREKSKSKEKGADVTRYIQRICYF